MLNNSNRFLAPLFQKAKEKTNEVLATNKIASPSPTQDVTIPNEFTPKDYLSFLLHVDAELERGLMLQYL